MKKKLFSYAIVFHAKEKGEESKILKTPEWILAESDKDVEKLAARQIPTEYDNKISQVEILVRPF